MHDDYCWTSFSISDRRLGPSGRSRQREWRCIIGHTLLRIVRWCILLTRLTLVCEVIRYHLIQIRQNLKKDFLGWRPTKAFLSLPLSCSPSSYFLSFSLQKVRRSYWRKACKSWRKELQKFSIWQVIFDSSVGQELIAQPSWRNVSMTLAWQITMAYVRDRANVNATDRHSVSRPLHNVLYCNLA